MSNPSQPDLMTDDLLLRAAKLFRRIDMDVDLCDLDDGKVSVAEVHAMTAELEARAAAEPTRDFVPDLTPETRRWLEDCIRDQGGAFDRSLDLACMKNATHLMALRALVEWVDDVRTRATAEPPHAVTVRDFIQHVGMHKNHQVRSQNFDVAADLREIERYSQRHAKLLGLEVSTARASVPTSSEPKIAADVLRELVTSAQQAIDAQLPEDEPDTIPQWCYETIVKRIMGEMLLLSDKSDPPAPPLVSVADDWTPSGTVQAFRCGTCGEWTTTGALCCGMIQKAPPQASPSSLDEALAFRQNTDGSDMSCGNCGGPQDSPSSEGHV